MQFRHTSAGWGLPIEWRDALDMYVKASYIHVARVERDE